jgi:C4-dicarboxylate-specific signal transduction histidine kinase
VRTALELLEASFKNHEIVIELTVIADAQAMGFSNEYSQTLLNILGNARDAIIEHHVKPGHVSIKISRDNENAYVVLRDNGGGIPEEILCKIFDPYFTTRKMGTGIGLYMSKMIVESNMLGRIEVRNIEGGAEFKIVTPLIKNTEF